MLRSAYKLFKSKNRFYPYYYIKVDFLDIFRKQTRLLVVGLAICFIIFILIKVQSPFGRTVSYNLNDSHKKISSLGPKERVISSNLEGQQQFRQTSDLIYFTTNMDQNFDIANIKLTYKNKSVNQNISIGFKDRNEWHFATKIFDEPILYNLNWHKSDGEPNLYGKDNNYNTIRDFINNPPNDVLVGIYNFDKNFLQRETIITGYTPNKNETVIASPFRGKTTFYTYIKNEPFIMKIHKQDLNWYDDPDPMIINVYKEGEVVYTALIDDDGIADASKKLGGVQIVTIKNPGPDLPESGVYKVVVDAGGDTTVKMIETNLHKIVFETPLFPIGNAEVYPGIVEKTGPLKLYTNAFNISVQTYHNEATQSVELGDETLKLGEVHKESSGSANTLIEMVIPKSDVIIKGLGHFAFSRDQFFEPSPFKILPVTQKEDLEKIDYLVTNYSIPLEVDGWKVAEQEFDLSTAVIEKGKLSWIIKAPGLKENNGEIIIKDVQVEFIKKPLGIFDKN